MFFKSLSVFTVGLINDETIERRQFLTRAGLIALLIPAAAVPIRCGSSGDSGENGNGETGDFTVTSSQNLSHVHTCTIKGQDLDNPPDSGVTYTSSSTGHTHSVTLSESQLEEIASGGSVTVTSSLNELHTHTFTIVKP